MVKVKKVLAIISNILAICIFGVGLLSPLTPSSGMPTVGSIAIFSGLPLALLFHSWRTYLSKPAKYAAIFQSLVIVNLAGWLLLIQSGLLTNSS